MSYLIVNLVVAAVVVLVVLYPAWRIAARAGFSPWISLLILVPAVGGLAYVLILAFADWPAAGRARSRG